ncbi:hypothetical protein M2162_007151 [Streptomyces sp. SAI-041]|nr:hypothetical protein [Streptomyces sp. SAI-041]
MGTLTNSTHRQFSHSTSTPPASSPIAPPPAETAAKTPKARLRSGPSRNVVLTRERAVGEAMAPPTPWRARAARSWPSFWASPPSSEASTNSSTPQTNIRRLPRMSPVRPPSSSSPPKVRV